MQQIEAQCDLSTEKCPDCVDGEVPEKMEDAWSNPFSLVFTACMVVFFRAFIPLGKGGQGTKAGAKRQLVLCLT